MEQSMSRVLSGSCHRVNFTRTLFRKPCNGVNQSNIVLMVHFFQSEYACYPGPAKYTENWIVKTDERGVFRNPMNSNIYCPLWPIILINLFPWSHRVRIVKAGRKLNCKDWPRIVKTDDWGVLRNPIPLRWLSNRSATHIHTFKRLLSFDIFIKWKWSSFVLLFLKFNHLP